MYTIKFFHAWKDRTQQYHAGALMDDEIAYQLGIHDSSNPRYETLVTSFSRLQKSGFYIAVRRVLNFL